MGKNLTFGVLILSFSLSSVNVGLAAPAVSPVSPVAPQQMLDQDRQNRDEEIAIRQLIEENDKLIQDTLARQQNEGLSKIDQAMLQYRNTLYSRDQARIQANSQPWGSNRYGDLVALTEEVDSMTEAIAQQRKSGMLAQKFQMLEQLRNEMALLNQKLQNHGEDVTQKDRIIEDYKKILQHEEAKIPILVARLDEMDKRIAQFDEIIAQKNHQIRQLKDALSMTQRNLATKDETIREQENQITLLEAKSTELPQPKPVPTVDPGAYNALQDQVGNLKNQTQLQADDLKAKDRLIKEQSDQISVLQKMSAAAPAAAAQSDELITSKDRQIARLKDDLAMAQSEVSSKDNIIKEEENRVNMLHQKLAVQPTMSASANNDFQQEIDSLKNEIKQQTEELSTKDRLIRERDASIRWLTQVLTAAKSKAEYFRLTSQKNQVTVRQVREEVRDIKEGFARQMKDYDQFEKDIVYLRNQVVRLGGELSEKQGQVDLLKSELENKITEEKDRTAQLQGKDNQLQDQNSQIVKMKTDIQSIVQGQSNLQELIGLAKKLIGLQNKEASLLLEMNKYREDENALFDKHFLFFENKIKQSLFGHQFQATALRHHMEAMKAQLEQKQEQLEAMKAQRDDLLVKERRQGVYEYQISDLKSQIRATDNQNTIEALQTALNLKEEQNRRLTEDLKAKIAQQHNQFVLEGQIRELKTQLADEEKQITALRAEIVSEQQTQQQSSALRQQVAEQENRVNLLKQQLDARNSQYNQMSALVTDYQQKLESRNSEYNEQLKQALATKNDQSVQMKAETKDLSARLQEAQAEVVRIKKAMYDLQQASAVKERDVQTRDLSASVQDTEIKNLKTDLALARQQLNGKPNSEEIDYLEASLKKATEQYKAQAQQITALTAELNEKEQAISKAKVSANEFSKQLQEANDALGEKQEDLKYKDMAILRLKEQYKQLQHEVKIPQGRYNEMELKRMLKDANEKIKSLEALLKAKPETKGEGDGARLKAALNKIDEQDSVINELNQKLREVQNQKVVLTPAPVKEVTTNNVAALQSELQMAHMRISNLETHLKELEEASKGDVLKDKLKQAMDQIDRQGKVVNLLIEKLHELGENVDLTKYFSKK
jgi:chromosome segregation ATPase